MKAELDEIKQFHSTSVSQRAFWFVAATPTVNQVYISESMLSKGVQLLFQTATFYLIFIPGLSLLFLACHIATHLHKSFWRAEKDWEGGKVKEGWRGRCSGMCPLLSLLGSFYSNNNNNQGRTTGTRRKTRAQNRGKHSIFNALFACCSVPVWVNGVSRV